MRLPRRLLIAAALAAALASPGTTVAAGVIATPDVRPLAQTDGGALIDKSGTPGSVPGTTYTLTPKTRSTSAAGLLGDAARVMLGLAGTAALAMFVWGGITWMLSRGNPKEVERGRAIMVWTAVGLAVMFGAEALVRAVLSALSSGAAT